LEGYRPGEAKHVALMNKIDTTNNRIHGNYDPNSPIAIKKTLLGPLLMQFRSWLPEAVSTRFEEEKYDPYLDRMVKGSFRTMFSSEYRQNLKAMMPMLLPSWARTQNMNKISEEIAEVDQENIRRFAAGVRQYLQVIILIAVLRALKDDEDDEGATYMLNYGLNVASRVDRDLKLFTPTGIKDMTQGNSLSAIGALEDLERFTSALMDSLNGDGTYTTGVHEGESKAWFKFKGLIPHLGAIQRMENNLTRELKY
jgi:hypothetical protein